MESELNDAIFRMPIQHAGTGACFEWEPTDRDRARAQRNHRQSLERLAERGGMSWGEMDAILRDNDWDTITEAGAQVRCNQEIERRNAVAAGWISASCRGETCHLADCDKPAFAKIGEEIMHDDPAPARHNLTAYVCEPHFRYLFGDRGVHFRNRFIENRGGPSATTHALLSRGKPDA